MPIPVKVRPLAEIAASVQAGYQIVNEEAQVLVAEIARLEQELATWTQRAGDLNFVLEAET